MSNLAKKVKGKYDVPNYDGGPMNNFGGNSPNYDVPKYDGGPMNNFGNGGSATKPTSPSIGNSDSTAAPSSPPKRDYYAEYEAAIRAQERAAKRRLQAQINQAVGRVEAQRPGINQQYDKAAQQAYIQKMMSQRDMGQQMAANGLSGGMAESARLGLENSYGENLNQLEQARGNALAGLDQDIADIRASGDISLAENANDHTTRLQEAIWQAQQAQMQYEAKQAGSRNVSGSSGASKPRLTYNQLQELYDSGDYGQDVIDGLSYYRPDNIWNEYTRRLEEQFKKDPGYRDRRVSPGGDHLAAYDIDSLLASGMISKEERDRMLLKIGLGAYL